MKEALVTTHTYTDCGEQSDLWRRETMKLLKIAALGATLMASTLSFNTVAQAQGRLNAAVADWTGAVVTGRLLMTILEREYDYKINYIELPSGNATLEAIAGGDIDLGFEYWPSYNPAKGTWFAEWGGPGTVKIVGETGVIGKSSYYVPRYLVEGDGAAAPLEGRMRSGPGLGLASV